MDALSFIVALAVFGILAAVAAHRDEAEMPDDDRKNADILEADDD